jgi:hypothetical protein
MLPVGFANGTGGDFALATGTLLNAGIVVGSAIGQPEKPAGTAVE